MKVTKNSGCVIAHRLDTWPILDARYRGVCRGRWWPLGEHREDAQARALTGVRENHLLTYSPTDLRVDSCTDLDYIRSYAEACDRLEIAPLYSLVCVALQANDAPVDWVENVRGQCIHLGVDVAYGSGSFSFINGDFGVEDDELARFLAIHLNDCGLFDSFDDAEEFMRLHQGALDRGVNLETLDDAMPIDLWEDRELIVVRNELRS